MTDPVRMEVRLNPLPDGVRYEDQYGKWLDVIKMIAQAVSNNREVVVTDAPATWASLLFYLGADLGGSSYPFEQDKYILNPISAATQAHADGMLRELVEMHSASRPELVDALYKADMEWDLDKSKWRHTWKREFKVTCNGSFFRPEVLEYLNEDLPRYFPKKPKCVIVPCAADKPYPADLHKAVRSVIPDDYEILIGTGVLGIVPESMWDIMPLYDSGMPNEWRLMRQATVFFTLHWYERVVLYVDFYSTAIWKGLMAVEDSKRPPFAFVNPIKEYHEYLNLLDPVLLGRLGRVCREEEV